MTRFSLVSSQKIIASTKHIILRSRDLKEFTTASLTARYTTRSLPNTSIRARHRILLCIVSAITRSFCQRNIFLSVFPKWFFPLILYDWKVTSNSRLPVSAARPTASTSFIRLTQQHFVKSKTYADPHTSLWQRIYWNCWRPAVPTDYFRPN
jgi:hypothetical protein